MTRPGRLGALFALVASASALLALQPVHAAAASVVPFSARMYLCSFEPEIDRVSGNKMLHLYNAVNHNLWVATTPLITGWEDNTVDGTINLEKGTGVAHAHSVMRPFAYDATWQVVVQLTVTPSGLDAYGIGHGTGALRGMTMKFRGAGAIDLQPGENPCSDVFLFAGLLDGEILVPGS